jgi:hypothetical protein
VEGRLWGMIVWSPRSRDGHATGRCRVAFATAQANAFLKAAGCGAPRSREAVMLRLDFLWGPARLAEGGAWRFERTPYAPLRTTPRSSASRLQLALPAGDPLVLDEINVSFRTIQRRGEFSSRISALETRPP